MDRVGNGDDAAMLINPSTRPHIHVSNTLPGVSNTDPTVSSTIQVCLTLNQISREVSSTPVGTSRR